MQDMSAREKRRNAKDLSDKIDNAPLQSKSTRGRKREISDTAAGASPVQTRTRTAAKNKALLKTVDNKSVILDSSSDASNTSKMKSLVVSLKDDRQCGTSTTKASNTFTNKVNLSKPMTDIFDLPEEIVLSIFEYLGHGDRLIVRLVCNRWKHLISNWKAFTNNVVFLCKSRTMASWTLSQSTTPWEKLRLEKFRLNEKGFGWFTLPPYLTHIVTSVEFSKSIVSWEGLTHNLLQFRALKELKITQCKRRRKETLKTKRRLAVSPSVRTRFRRNSQDTLNGILNSVTSISLELRKISDMVFYIDQFNHHLVSNLQDLCLTDIFEGKPVSPSTTSDFFAGIFKLLDRSSASLKCLKVNISSPEIRDLFFNVFTYIKDKCTGISLHTLDIARFGQSELANRDIEIFQGLLENQSNIQELRLPYPTSVLREKCQQLIRVIPKNIAKLYMPSDKYMVPEFFQYFDKLENFQCDFDIRQFLLQPAVTNRRLRYLEGQGLFSNITVPLIVTSFPNITKLNLNGISGELPAMDDSVLQLIFKHLKKITSLIIGSCSRISDFGITGIKTDYCRKLYRSRALCLDSTLDIPQDMIVGLPLSELKGLTELTFAESTMITDVGIFYGFRLRELRHLNMRNNDDITDWGLDWLVKLNPDLHWLYYGCGRWVSSLGITRIKTRLRRIEKRNCIYLWPDDEYCSSDDSYAIESDEY